MIEEHLGYITDTKRSARFQAAVKRVIQDADVVLDLGCGSGVLGLMCLQQGAARVEGVDETPILELARRAYELAGYADRVRLHRTSSHLLTLDSRVDLVICDQVGYLGIDYGILQTLADAKARLLKPGGRLLPRSVDIFLAPAGGPRTSKATRAWLMPQVPGAFRFARDYVVNSKLAVRLTPGEIKGQPAAVATYRLGDAPPPLHRWMAEWTAEEHCQIEGVAGWFSAKLAPGVQMTNSPLSRAAIKRSQGLLPLSEPIRVRAGDRVSAEVLIRPEENIIKWTVAHPASGTVHTHNTLRGMLLSSRELRQAISSSQPRLSEQGRAQLTALGLCNGTRSKLEIEAALFAAHPEVFPTQVEAARFLAHCLRQST